MADPAVDLDRVSQLERLLLKVWPAAETEERGKWVVRASDGFTKRANSAFAIAQGATLARADIDALIKYYSHRNQDTVVRLSPLVDPAVFAKLDALGFAAIEPTYCLFHSDCSVIAGADPAVSHADAPSENWVAANGAAYGGIKNRPQQLLDITRRIACPVSFATVHDGNREIAWGLAAATDGWVCLLNLVVDPAWRGAGVGRRLVRSLIDWGVDNGARRCFLQTLQDNAAAVGLYRGLGYSVAYSYYHRVRAAPAG